MNCKALMTKDPVCCVPGDTVQKAAQLMKAENIGPMPVIVDEKNKTLVGILTDRDLAVRVVAEARDPVSTTVQQVMTTGAISCRADDDLREALYAMEQYQVRRIPVVDENEEIIGIIRKLISPTACKAPRIQPRLEEISKSRGGSIVERPTACRRWRSAERHLARRGAAASRNQPMNVSHRPPNLAVENGRGRE
jgi:CBS domain-containing protein